MRKLIYTIAFISLLVVVYSGLQCYVVLSLLEKNYPYPKPGFVKLIKSSRPAKTLVIGCSNVQHNLDIRLLQDSMAVDFLYFAGSENSTFLQYLIDKKLTAGYEAIVLYAPYHLLQKSDRFQGAPFHLPQLGSYDYSKSVLTHHPKMIFYPWPSYYNKVAKSRPPGNDPEFVVNYDKKIDSLINHPTDYRRCDLPYVSAKQVFDLPVYTKADEPFVKTYAGEGQQLYLIFPPLPDVKEFRASSFDKIPASFSSIEQLNKPQLLDSTLFYDQWYHLDYCGREVETGFFMQALKKLPVSLR